MNSRKSQNPFLLSAFFVLWISCAKKENEPMIDCSNSTQSYASDISPIIIKNCLASGCHNSGSGNGDYTAYDGLNAVASSGVLENRVVTNKNMPPTAPLSFEDRKKIKCWINSGAPKN